VAYDPGEHHNYHYVVAEVDSALAGVDRDRLVQVLHAEGVLARRYFWPGCHRIEPYCSQAPLAGWRLPETERLAARTLVLPTGTAIGDEEIDTIADILSTAARAAGRRPGE